MTDTEKQGGKKRQIQLCIIGSLSPNRNYVMKMTVTWDVAPCSLVKLTDVSRVLAASNMKATMSKPRARKCGGNVWRDEFLSLMNSDNPC
jgi:hypothetical protein